MFVLINSYYSPSSTNYIARQLHVVLNNLQQVSIDNYVADYTIPKKFKIFDDKGTLVYGDGVHDIFHDKSENYEYPPPSKEGIAIFDKIEQYEMDMITTKLFSYVNRVSLNSPMIDYKIVEESLYNLVDFDEFNYNKMISNYNNRDFEYFIQYGNYAKYTADKLKSDIGEDNVKIINITRHPLVCLILNVSTLFQAYYAQLRNLFLANAIFQKDSSVSNYRFEDILKSQKLVFNNISIDLPLLTPHNNYVTKDEMNNWITPAIINSGYLDLADISNFKEFFTNLKRFYETNVDDHVYDENEEVKEVIFDASRVPSDIFEELGYNCSESDTQLTSLYTKSST